MFAFFLVKIPLDKVKGEWSKTRGLKEVAFLAKYYGIFRDLFDGKEYQPNIWLDIEYQNVFAHRGNIIAPSEVCTVSQRMLSIIFARV